MKIILTNDDGIDAPGLHALYQILKDQAMTVVVAPQKPQSGVGHRVTVDSPIQLTKIAKNRYAVDGTPADCVRIALKHIAPDAEWLFAGINPGANLGSDVYNSGTVAGAREAAILGCRSAAVSQYIAKDHPLDWDLTRHHTARVVRALLDKDPGTGYFWNANLPHPLVSDIDPDIIFCNLDTNPHEYSYREQGDHLIYEGTIHTRPRDEGLDVAVCFGGKISVTRIAVGTY